MLPKDVRTKKSSTCHASLNDLHLTSCWFLPRKNDFWAKFVCFPAAPDTDFSHGAHMRRREEWQLMGRRDRALETPEER
jgi:hypothetical protein